MIAVLDGGLGTELETKIPRDDKFSPLGHPLWLGQVLLNRPQWVEAVHADYLRAGATILTTATYQLSQASLVRAQCGDSLAVWSSAVTVATNAIRNTGINARIAGSVGPYATYLANGSEYTGKYGGITEAELVAYHRPLVSFLASESRVDMLAFETIPNIVELRAVVEVTKAVSKPYYILMNATAGGLVDGTPLEEVISVLSTVQDTNFMAVGINCVDFKTCADTIRALSRFPVFVYPNMGYEYNQQEGFYGVTYDDDAWTKAVEEWASLPNVRAIGGCCSTRPHEIAIVKQVVSRED